MNSLKQWAAKLMQHRKLLAAALVVLGLAITVFFGLRAVRSFQQMRYIHEQGIDRGVAGVDAIRPWMTIRFIAIAYAVPEEYIYDQLQIPFNRRDADTSLGQLNKIYDLGLSPANNELVIVERIKAAVTAYQANPVVTGLRDVRPWMSIRYISHSTGVPEEYLFQQIGLAKEGNETKPLDILSDDLNYKDGPRALVEAVQKALEEYKKSP